MRALRAPGARVFAAWLLLSVLLTVSLQSRLAEIDFNDDGGPGYVFENNDALDGEEILTRLILVDDLVMPEAPLWSAIVLWSPPIEALASVFPPPLHRLTSRAPPALPLSV